MAGAVCGRPGAVRWGVFFLEGVLRRFLRRRCARPRGLVLSSSTSESLASEWEMGEEEGERDHEGVTYSCCCRCRWCWAVRGRGSSSRFSPHSVRL